MSITSPSHPGEAQTGVSASTPPRVSIGLPVYNGERFLAQALDSVLAQTFSDFEVIICDNASTDETPRICKSFLERDARIRYHCNEINIGGDRNYNRCVELSRGEYFLGVAHDDVLAPDYLRRCVEALDLEPAIVFCHTQALRIDEHGEVTGTFDAHRFSESPRASERFFDATALAVGVVACLGVVRTSVLREIAPLVTYVSADVYRQAELALRGRLFEVPEFLFRRRVYPESGGRIPIHQRLVWSDPTRRAALTFPAWRRLGEFARAIGRTPLPLGERLRCFGQIGHFVVRRRWWPRLARDLRMVPYSLMHRMAWTHRILEKRHRRRKPG